MSDKGRGPLGDLKNAFQAGLRIISAVEPLAELQKMTEEDEARAPPPSRRTPVTSDCKVCNGTLQVGEPGNEVNCPACITIEVKPAHCLTCGGKGKVGSKGHQIQCPVCKGKG